jgi:hypothetical protein
MEEEIQPEEPELIAPYEVKLTWKAILLTPYYFVKALLTSW